MKLNWTIIIIDSSTVTYMNEITCIVTLFFIFMMTNIKIKWYRHPLNIVYEDLIIIRYCIRNGHNFGQLFENINIVLWNTLSIS